MQRFVYKSDLEFQWAIHQPNDLNLCVLEKTACTLLNNAHIKELLNLEQRKYVS